MSRFRWSSVSVWLIVAGCFATAPVAKSTVIFDSGNVTFAPTGTQFGRLARNNVASDWAEAKAFPGVLGAPTARSYEAFAINSGPYSYIQIQLDDPSTAFIVAAYLNAFSPVNSAPNYGLDTNYLGDPGSSQPFGNPAFFQIMVAPNSRIVLPVSEVNPNGGAGAVFNLLVEGFAGPDYSEVPEPSSLVLISSGAAFVAFRQLRKKAVRS